MPVNIHQIFINQLKKKKKQARMIFNVNQLHHKEKKPVYFPYNSISQKPINIG